MRNTNEFESKILSGTEGASSPFFSPDSRWVAFFCDGMLKKISLMGGSSQIICQARSGLEGCWNQDDFIIFSNATNRGLMRVNSSGGTPEQITNALNYTQGEEEQAHFNPQILPGNEIILFTVWHNSQDMRIVAYSPKTEERWTIIENGGDAKYIRPGYLIYLWKGDLLAVRFNVKKMQVIGDIMVLQKGIAHFSTSDGGSLAYIQGDVIENNNKLIIIKKIRNPNPSILPLSNHLVFHLMDHNYCILVVLLHYRFVI